MYIRLRITFAAKTTCSCIAHTMQLGIRLTHQESHISNKRDRNKAALTVAITFVFLFSELSKIFATRIHKLLLERDDKCPEDQRLWLQHEALRQGHLQETGTFRKALSQKLSSIVSPMLSEVIAYCDQNHNLDLLREGKEWKTRLWLTMISDEVIAPLTYDSFISPVSGRLRERARVLSSGAGPRFKGKFPFSWIIKDLVNVHLINIRGEYFS